MARFWPTVDEQTGKSLYLDNEYYNFAEIQRRSRIGKLTLQKKRRAGVLIVRADSPSVAPGWSVVWALRHNTPQPLPRGLDKTMFLNATKAQISELSESRVQI